MTDEQRNQYGELIQDANQDANRNWKFYGPVIVNEWYADASGSVFIVRDEDRKLLPEDAYGARAPKKLSMVRTLMAKAFNQKIPVSVIPTHRWWIAPGQFVWTISQAKIVRTQSQ